MSDALFLPIAGIMIASSFWRHPGRIVFILAVGIGASLLVRGAPFAETTEGVILSAFAIDTMSVVLLGQPWTHHPNVRARTVATVGFVKLLGHTWAFGRIGGNGVIPHMEYSLYAWSIGLAYLLQVAISGGFFDALGLWVDCHLRRHVPRPYLSHRNVER